MPVNLKGRSLLTLKDFTPDEIRYLLNLAADLKAKKRAGIPGDLLAGKNIVLLFEKTSTRTRCAFEVAALDEGAHVTFLSNSQMGKKESLEDTAKVLGRFYDGIEFRGFKQETVELLAKHAGPYGTASPTCIIPLRFLQTASPSWKTSPSPSTRSSSFMSVMHATTWATPS